MKFKGLSFKKDPRETGLAAFVAGEPNTNIKLNKINIGYIYGPNWRSKDNLWRITITVRKDAADIQEGCDWRWLTFAKTFETEPECREWLHKNMDGIKAKYNIHFQD